MENILKENEIVNTDKAIITKLAFGATSKSKDVIKAVDNIHSINQKLPKSIIEKALYQKDIDDNLDPFKDEPEPINLEEEKVISKLVDANIFKEKVKKATQEKLATVKPKVVLTEQEIVAKKVQANIIKEKVKKASQIEIEKISPPTPKKEYVAPPTIESIYLDRTLADNKTLYIDDYRRDGGNIYKWVDYWKVQNPDDIKADITQWLKTNHDTQLSSKNVNSIFNVFYFKLQALDMTPSKDLYIPTKNFWLMMNQSTGDITAIKPNKAIALTYQINVKINKLGPYKPTQMASNSLFSKFINSSLPEADKQALVQEYSGYTLTTDTQAQKFTYHLGDGGNGKSVLVELLTAINPSSVATNMENIGKYNDNFIGKSLIFATETNKRGFDIEFLKAAVSGDTVEVRGIRKEKQSVKLVSKWWMLGNSDFRVDDFSNGLFRRMIIVKWNVSFTGANQIKDLARQILDNELDILLNWCLLGLQRLIKNKLIFTECEESERALFNFKNHADKIRMFTNDYQYEYVEDKSGYTFKDDLYNKFIDYADKNGFEKLNSTNFWLRMKNIYPKIEDDIENRKRINGKRIVYLKLKQQQIYD